MFTFETFCQIMTIERGVKAFVLEPKYLDGLSVEEKSIIDIEPLVCGMVCIYYPKGFYIPKIPDKPKIDFAKEIKKAIKEMDFDKLAEIKQRMKENEKL